MGLYISDDYGLGFSEMVLVALATDSIEHHLELEPKRRRAERVLARRDRVRPRSNESRWPLPRK